LPLICDWPNRPRQIVEHTIGKPSLTRWRVLARDAQANTTRVELSPVTGRSHQPLVHLAALGHWILGDSLCATQEALGISSRLCFTPHHFALSTPFHGQKFQSNRTYRFERNMNVI
jgi:tRNA pseudouridine32 synthase / 23S rRNA pseudouridine746 synthase